MFNVNEIRKDFPMLDNTMMQGHKLVYFDSAATSLKPKCVIEAMKLENEVVSTAEGTVKQVGSILGALHADAVLNADDVYGNLAFA